MSAEQDVRDLFDAFNAGGAMRAEDYLVASSHRIRNKSVFHDNHKSY